ncbi:hypothetical protein ACP70R_034317 [Stipagrostis hirtigluma subsp. patula]
MARPASSSLLLVPPPLASARRDSLLPPGWPPLLPSPRRPPHLCEPTGGGGESGSVSGRVGPWQQRDPKRGGGGLAAGRGESLVAAATAWWLRWRHHWRDGVAGSRGRERLRVSADPEEPLPRGHDACLRARRHGAMAGGGVEGRIGGVDTASARAHSARASHGRHALSSAVSSVGAISGHRGARCAARRSGCVKALLAIHLDAPPLPTVGSPRPRRPAPPSPATAHHPPPSSASQPLPAACPRCPPQREKEQQLFFASVAAGRKQHC